MVYSQIILLIFSFDCIICNKPKVIELEADGKYKPTWESLDTRPLPEWFDKAKIGIFIHWGVFSVPSYGSEWFWSHWYNRDEDVVDFMKYNYRPRFTYQDFGPQFTTEFFRPNQWAELFFKSGAKYVVLTSKHHEGFTLWPSKYSFGWNSMDIGPKRDLVGELAQAVRNKSLVFGLYHSLYEWFNPLYISDRKRNFTSKDFVEKKMLPEMYELVNNYQPEVIWSDGDWETYDTYFNSTEFIAWLYNESPVKDTVVVNDRWGIGIPCKHGDFYSCQDRYNPGVLQNHKWENAMTIDKHSWGYRREATLSDYLTTHELIKTVAETISCGGNILINVGPTKEGTINIIFEERLLNLGEWLSINGEAIYESKPWVKQNDSLTEGIWYTSKAPIIYAIVLNWPKENLLNLQAINDYFRIENIDIFLLGNEDNQLKWFRNETFDALSIVFPDKAKVKSQWAWVLKLVLNRIYL